MVKVKIDNPGASTYPFTFKKGDLVVEAAAGSIDTDTTGEIVDGEYEATGHWYSITYTIKRTKDGFTTRQKS